GATPGYWKIDNRRDEIGSSFRLSWFGAGDHCANQGGTISAKEGARDRDGRLRRINFSAFTGDRCGASRPNLGRAAYRRESQFLTLLQAEAKTSILGRCGGSIPALCPGKFAAEILGLSSVA